MATGLMRVVLVTMRPHDRELVDDFATVRKDLGNLGSWDIRGNWLKRAANLGRRFRLEVPHVDMTGAALEHDKDARFNSRLRLRCLGILHREQLR